MSTQVFFNRPVRPIDLRLLYADMSKTFDHLVIASAWFTDSDLARRFVESPSDRKTTIFNAADMDRGEKEAYKVIKSYFNDSVLNRNDNESEEDIIFTGGSAGEYGIAEPPGWNPSARYRFVVLGSGNWQEGVMHHKFILCDKVVWVGSYNFTFQARKNYETLIRIDDAAIVGMFYKEVEALMDETELQSGTYIVNGATRCYECGKLLAERDIEHTTDGGYGSHLSYCRKCWRELQAKYPTAH